MSKRVKVLIILAVSTIAVAGWLFYTSPLSAPIRYQLLRCPEGYKKFGSMLGGYCATDSQKPCSSHAECPENENCISNDGKNWFCSGRWAGCYFRDPEDPEFGPLCAD